VIFCPYCNALLENTPHGELQCSNSGSLFSLRVSERLRELAGDGANWTEAVPEYRPTRWFCPKCGIEMIEQQCRCCDFQLDRALHREILELNPHIPF